MLIAKNAGNAEILEQGSRDRDLAQVLLQDPDATQTDLHDPDARAPKGS